MLISTCIMISCQNELRGYLKTRSLQQQQVAASSVFCALRFLKLLLEKVGSHSHSSYQHQISSAQLQELFIIVLHLRFVTLHYRIINTHHAQFRWGKCIENYCSELTNDLNLFAKITPIEFQCENYLACETFFL